MKKSLLLSLFICIQIFLFANAKDTLKAIEGQPVYSTIITLNNDTIHCYIEYHDYIREYVSLGKYNVITYSFNPRFPYKERLSLDCRLIKYLMLGKDKYARILEDDKSAGILVKEILDGQTKLYRYKLEDYKDMKQKDSTYSSSLGLSLTRYDYAIFSTKQDNYNLIDLTLTKLELAINLHANAYKYILHEDEMKLELSLLMSHCTNSNVPLLPQTYNWKEILKYVKAINNCSK